MQFAGELRAYQPKPGVTWLHVLWLVALVIFILQQWYFTLDWREKEAIRSFPQYLLAFFFPTGTYIISVLLCPDHEEPIFTKLDNILAVRGHLVYVLAGLTMLVAAIEGELIEKKAGLELAYPRATLARVSFGCAFVLVGLIGMKWKHELAIGLLGLSASFRLLMARRSH